MDLTICDETVCRGVTRGARGVQFPGRRVNIGAPNNCGGVEWLWGQNRRQKLFNRGLCVYAVGLSMQKLTKTLLIHSVSYFSLGGLELCLEG